MAPLTFLQFFFIDCIYELSNTIDGWSNQIPTTDCGGTQITGGYETFGENSIAEKTFFLPPHKKIRISIDFFLIDSWDNEKLELKIDGQSTLIVKAHYSDPQGTQICGQTHWLEHKYYFSTEFYDHTKNSITLQIQTFLNQNTWDESLGWKAKIEYMQDPCFQFYSQKYYQGREYQFCQNQQSKPNFDRTFIWSFKIPPGQYLILQGEDFSVGYTLKYTEDQPALQNPFQVIVRIKQLPNQI